jgi:3-mercaptopyruvate sulfurtransferase SseA
MIACSLLQRAGLKNVINVTGGLDAWQKAQLPISTGATGRDITGYAPEGSSAISRSPRFPRHPATTCELLRRSL